MKKVYIGVRVKDETLEYLKQRAKRERRRGPHEQARVCLEENQADFGKSNRLKEAAAISG